MKKRIFLFILCITFLSGSLNAGYFDFLKKLTPAQHFVGIIGASAIAWLSLYKYKGLQKINDNWYYIANQNGQVSIVKDKNDNITKLSLSNPAKYFFPVKYVEEADTHFYGPLNDANERRQIMYDTYSLTGKKLFGTFEREIQIREEDGEYRIFKPDRYGFWPKKGEFIKGLLLSGVGVSSLLGGLYILFKK